MRKASFILLSIFLLISACSKDPNVREMEKAAKAVEQMVSPFYASRISFFVVFPNGTPRQFVSWYFSSLGSADWAPTDKEGELREEELASLRQIGMTLRPEGIYYRHSKPDTSVQKQIVLKWDDEAGMVILEGYIDPGQEPIFTSSFKLPKGVVPDAMAKAVAESNLELGMSFQSF